MTAAAAACAVLATLLVVSPRAAPSCEGRVVPRSSARREPAVLVSSVALLTAVVLLLDGTALTAGLLGVAALAGAGLLLRQARRARAAERRSELLVEAGEALVGELLAGQPLVSALHRSVTVWPELEPVASASALGADVPAAMRRLASRPGAEAMAEVAAAWQLGQASGAGLAGSLEQVLVTTRARQETRRRVGAELASARATARLVGVLPMLSLIAAQGIGAEPWQFLLDTPAGVACLTGGVLLGFTGLWWIERIAVSVLREAG